MRLTVNGADVEVDDRFAASPLLWVLRDALGMHGTKYGCDASIIPEVLSSTTNVIVIVLAERIYQRVYAS